METILLIALLALLIALAFTPDSSICPNCGRRKLSKGRTTDIHGNQYNHFKCDCGEEWNEIIV